MHDLFAHTRVARSAPSLNTFSRPFSIGETPTGAAKGGCAPHAERIPYSEIGSAPHHNRTRLEASANFVIHDETYWGFSVGQDITPLLTTTHAKSGNDLKNNEAARKAFQAGAWNKFRIECCGESIKTWLNDLAAADLKNRRVHSGFIGLQVHGVSTNEMPLEVRFRNIRLQELQ